MAVAGIMWPDRLSGGGGSGRIRLIAKRAAKQNGLSALQVIELSERVPPEPRIDAAPGVDGRATCCLAGQPGGSQ